MILGLQSQGYSENTIKGYDKKLRILARVVRLDDPKAVKRLIAEKVNNSYKEALVSAYIHYARVHETPVPKVQNGMKIYELLSSPTTRLATITVNDREKLVFHNSTFCIDLITGYWKYGVNGCELQFNCYSLEPPALEPRVDKPQKYNRGEIGYLPGTHKTADKLRRVADQIDAIIGYSEPVIEYSSKPKRKTKNIAEILSE